MVGKIRTFLRNYTDPVRRAAEKVRKQIENKEKREMNSTFRANVVAPRKTFTDRRVLRWDNKAHKANAKARIHEQKANLGIAKANAFLAGVVSRGPLSPVGLMLRGLAWYNKEMAKRNAVKAGKLKARAMLFEEARRRADAVRDLETAKAELERVKAQAIERQIVAIEQRLIIDTPKRVKFIKKLEGLKNLDMLNSFLNSYLSSIQTLLKDKSLDKKTRAAYSDRKRVLTEKLRDNPNIIIDKIKELVANAESLEKRFLQTNEREQEKIAKKVLILYHKAQKINDFVSSPAKLFQISEEYLNQGILRYNMDDLLELLGIVK
ncbi:MAG: hypothetical protein QXZ13_01170 [Candidatus Diapherotrites archaeon]